MSGRLRIFPDTGVLLAMVVYPRDRHGATTLAGEVLELQHAGAFEVVLSQAVVDELDEVLDERFPAHRLGAASLLRPFAGTLIRRPTPAEVEATLPACIGPSDAPIFASAIITRPDILLSNDFQAFHAPAAKALWEKHGITVESLYGLLCVLGKRPRKSNDTT